MMAMRMILQKIMLGFMLSEILQILWGFSTKVSGELLHNSHFFENSLYMLL